jgi:predicted enzyme related to lactoylglutathione lyase
MSSSAFGRLAYLYIGTADFDRDFAFYKDVLGAPLVWRFTKFGARVAAFRVGEGPLCLIADHRPAPSCMPIFAVESLERAAKELRARGWKPEGGPFEIPDGSCYRFNDPSGNPFAILEMTRPGALQKVYRGDE